MKMKESKSRINIFCFLPLSPNLLKSENYVIHITQITTPTVQTYSRYDISTRSIKYLRINQISKV